MSASIVKTVMFTVVFPGTVGVYIPYRLRASDLPPVTAFNVGFRDVGVLLSICA